MFNIDFYETSKGHSDVREFIESLRVKAETSKDARIQYGQIVRYIELLQNNGTNLPVEVVKYLEDDIWEMRPGNNRVFFFYHSNDTYVLLHHYRKKSQKTPRREMIKAISEKLDYISQKGV